MFIDRFVKNKKEDQDSEEVDSFFFVHKTEHSARPSEVKRPVPHHHHFVRHTLLQWQAPEYEIYEKGQRWYFYAALILAAIIGYALYTNSPLMAITFVLIGVVGYTFLIRTPSILDFAITSEGVVASKEIYEYDHIHSFWIFYDPNDRKVISLHMKHSLLPYVHIPLHEQDPVLVRELLMRYIPEEKQRPSFIDHFERIFGI